MAHTEARSKWIGRAFLVRIALALAACAIVSVPRATTASSMIAATVKDLVANSDAVVVGIPKSRICRYEDKQIITYTTVAIDRVVFGSVVAAGSITVRTLGGIIGDDGQLVIGEATLPLDAPQLLFTFLIPAAFPTAMPGSRGITGMSQGAMPLVVGDDRVPRIGPSATGLSLFPQANPNAVAANVATNGRPLTDVVRDVRDLFTARTKR
ncbi:MAG: hypothetical protein NVSMB1_01650 [Polyangiales bacterium]